MSARFAAGAVGVLCALIAPSAYRHSDDAAPPADAGVDRTPVLIDYNPTVSDVGALLYLAVHPEVDLVAVTVVGTGESHCTSAVPFTVALLESVGHPDVPVACGTEHPVGAGRLWPDEWREAADGLAPDDVAPIVVADVPGDATGLIGGTAASVQGLVIVALGPLTNLAEALDEQPDLANHVAMTYSMGGAFTTPGNAPDGAAEWNYAVDPVAVDRVVRSGLPLTIVPLDATDALPADHAFARRLAESPIGSAADVVSGVWNETRPWESAFFLWDELTATLAVEPALATITTQHVVVDTDGADAGRTLVAADGFPVRVAANPDRRAVEHELVTRLVNG